MSSDVSLVSLRRELADMEEHFASIWRAKPAAKSQQAATQRHAGRQADVPRSVMETAPAHDSLRLPQRVWHRIVGLFNRLLGRSE